MTSFYCNTEQVWLSLISINFCGSYASFGTSNIGNTQFSALFSCILWLIELKFFILLCFTVLQIKFECCQFTSVFVGAMPLLELKILEYTVFRTFLLHTLTYWAKILHMTLFSCTTDQVQVSSNCVNFCGSYAPFEIKNTGNTQFSALFSYMLWHIELKFCIWLCFTVLQIKFECHQFASIFVGFMPLSELRILEIHSFLLFPLTCFDILSWNFTYDFVLLYYKSSSSVVN